MALTHAREHWPSVWTRRPDRIEARSRVGSDSISISPPRAWTRVSQRLHTLAWMYVLARTFIWTGFCECTHRDACNDMYTHTERERERRGCLWACLPLNVQFVCKLRFAQLRSLLDRALMIFEIFGDEQDERVSGNAEIDKNEERKWKIVLCLLIVASASAPGKWWIYIRKFFSSFVNWITILVYCVLRANAVIFYFNNIISYFNIITV